MSIKLSYILYTQIPQPIQQILTGDVFDEFCNWSVVCQRTPCCLHVWQLRDKLLNLSNRFRMVPFLKKSITKVRSHSDELATHRLDHFTMSKSFPVVSAAADTVRDVQLFRQNTLHLYTKITASPITALWWLEETSHNATGASGCFFPFCQLLCQCWQSLFSTFVWPATTNFSSASLSANIFFLCKDKS